MAPTRSEPNQRPPLFVGHQLNERHALKSPHSSGEKKGRLTNSRDWPIKLAVERKSANVPNKTNCFEKKKRRISLNKHGEANKPTLPPNTYAIWLLIQLPPAANDPWQTQNSSQRKTSCPEPRKQQQKEEEKSLVFFFHQVVVTSAVTRFKVPRRQPDLYHSLSYLVPFPPDQQLVLQPVFA